MVGASLVKSGAIQIEFGATKLKAKQRTTGGAWKAPVAAGLVLAAVFVALLILAQRDEVSGAVGMILLACLVLGPVIPFFLFAKGFAIDVKGNAANGFRIESASQTAIFSGTFRVEALDGGSIGVLRSNAVSIGALMRARTSIEDNTGRTVARFEETGVKRGLAYLLTGLFGATGRRLAPPSNFHLVAADTGEAVGKFKQKGTRSDPTGALSLPPPKNLGFDPRLALAAAILHFGH
jgi:hypothetical protein